MRKFALLALAAFSPIAHADIDIEISVTVPEICWVEIGPMEIASAESIYFPRMREYCNTDGYRLVIEYDPDDLTGATILYRGERRVLSGSGVAEVTREAEPIDRSSSLSIFLIDPLDGDDTNISLDVE